MCDKCNCGTKKIDIQNEIEQSKEEQYQLHRRGIIRELAIYGECETYEVWVDRLRQDGFTVNKHEIKSWGETTTWYTVVV